MDSVPTTRRHALALLALGLTASANRAYAASSGGSGSGIARKRVVGKTGSAGPVNLTTVCVVRAPAHFDHVRVILHVAQKNLPGSAVKLTVAPSARAGHNPVTAENTPIAFTPVTFGGANSILVDNKPNSANHGVVENDYTSDRIPLPSLERADMRGAPPLIHVRLQAQSYCPAANHSVGGPDAVTEPDYVSGTYGGDRTGNAVQAAPSNTTYHAPVTIVFYLRGAKVVTIGCAGDSTMQGSWSSDLAVDGSSNKFNGFPRQLKDLLVRGGIPCSLEQMCYHGEPSFNFHELARNALNTIEGAGLTHLMVYPTSVNDGTEIERWRDARMRTLALVELALSRGVVPIVLRNPPGYEPGTAQTNGYNAFLDELKAGGRALVYDPRPAMGLARAGYPRMPPSGRLHDRAGGIVAGDAHPNDAYHAAIAADLHSRRQEFKLSEA